jgi:arylsulfatase A-like enzyme
VLSNVDPYGGFQLFEDDSTLATWLTDDYATSLVGKYLNDYADTDADRRHVPPGWDAWKASVEPGTYKYTNQVINTNGRLIGYPGEYSTRLYGRLGRGFLDHQGSQQPFFLHESFVAPHAGSPLDPGDDRQYGPYVEAKYRDTYTGPRKPTENGVLDGSYNEADVSDKQSGVENNDLLTADQRYKIGETIAQRRESLRSVDDEISATMDKVKAMGQMDNTYFILVSDNGLMQGQHRTGGKGVAYEPAARIPLTIRGPGIARGATYKGLTGMQDIAPTVVDMTNQTDAPVTDGRSLLPLLGATATPDRSVLLEVANYPYLSDQQVAASSNEKALLPDNAPEEPNWQIRGVVTADRWKYVRYPQRGTVEMYDLSTDPYELDNLAGKPAFAEKEAALESELQATKDCDGLACR